MQGTHPSSKRIHIDGGYTVAEVWMGFRSVFSRPVFVMLAASICMGILFVTVWFSNWRFLAILFQNPIFSANVRSTVLLSTVSVWDGNFTPLSKATSVVIAGMAGINIASVVYYFQMRIAHQRFAGTGFVGILLGLVGVGCTSCGSVIASTLLGASASARFFGILPFRGTEISFVSIVILWVSTMVILRQIARSDICSLNR